MASIIIRLLLLLPGMLSVIGAVLFEVVLSGMLSVLEAVVFEAPLLGMLSMFDEVLFVVLLLDSRNHCIEVAIKLNVEFSKIEDILNIKIFING